MSQILWSPFALVAFGLSISNLCLDFSFLVHVQIWLIYKWIRTPHCSLVIIPKSSSTNNLDPQQISTSRHPPNYKFLFTLREIIYLITHHDIFQHCSAPYDKRSQQPLVLCNQLQSKLKGYQEVSQLYSLLSLMQCMAILSQD